MKYYNLRCSKFHQTSINYDLLWAWIVIGVDNQHGNPTLLCCVLLISESAVSLSVYFRETLDTSLCDVLGGDT